MLSPELLSAFEVSFPHIVRFSVCPGPQGLEYWRDYFSRQWQGLTIHSSITGLWEGTPEETFQVELWLADDIHLLFALLEELNTYRFQAEQDCVGVIFSLYGQQFADLIWGEPDVERLSRLIQAVLVTD